MYRKDSEDIALKNVVQMISVLGEKNVVLIPTNNTCPELICDDNLEVPANWMNLDVRCVNVTRSMPNVQMRSLSKVLQL